MKNKLNKKFSYLIQFLEGWAGRNSEVSAHG